MPCARLDPPLALAVTLKPSAVASAPSRVARQLRSLRAKPALECGGSLAQEHLARPTCGLSCFVRSKAIFSRSSRRSTIRATGRSHTTRGRGRRATFRDRIPRPTHARHADHLRRARSPASAPRRRMRERLVRGTARGCAARPAAQPVRLTVAGTPRWSMLERAWPRPEPRVWVSAARQSQVSFECVPMRHSGVSLIPLGERSPAGLTETPAGMARSSKTRRQSSAGP
jgi:hypothetical protein